MKRVHIAILAVVLAVLLFAALLLGWYSASHVQSAAISSFEPNGSLNPGGVTWSAKFVINVVNNGTVDLENLTLTFNTTSPYTVERSIVITDPHDYTVSGVTMGQPYVLAPLGAVQNVTVYGYVENNLDDHAKLNGYSVTATLKLGDKVLDQANLTGDFIFYSFK